MWEYLYESSAWSIGGLVIGYILGRTEREVREIKKTVDDNHEESKEKGSDDHA